MAKTSLDRYNDTLKKYGNVVAKLVAQGKDITQDNIQKYGESWGMLKAPKPKGSSIKKEVISKKDFIARLKAGDIQGFFRFVKGSDLVTLFGEGVVNAKQHKRDYYLDVSCKYFDSIPKEENEDKLRKSFRKLGMSVGKTISREVVEGKVEEDSTDSLDSDTPEDNVADDLDLDLDAGEEEAEEEIDL